MLKRIVLGVILSLIILILEANCNLFAYENKDIVVSNGIFSFTLPKKIQKTFEIKKRKKGIFIYHTESKKAGFGGFAFGIEAFLYPSDYAQDPRCRKIGELISKNGKLYDIVLLQPTDVQYDYTKDPIAPYLFKILYDMPQKLAIKGVGKNKYFTGQGTKGEYLYNDILNKHITAIKENWTPEKLEKENMSYMYYQIPKDKIGYTYYDVNNDGIEELLIGEITKGDLNGIIYDMYTMVNRKPEHVVSAGNRNRYFICNNSFVCNEYSSSANESGLDTYTLVENSTELYPQVNFKYDRYKNPRNPWFISYGNGEWENVSEKTFNDRKMTFEIYVRFNYKPLIEVIK